MPLFILFCIDSLSDDLLESTMAVYISTGLILVS